MKLGFITTAVILFIFSFLSYSQSKEIQKCGTTEMTSLYLAKHPELQKQIEEAENQLQQHTDQFTGSNKSSGGTVYTIPVVFHILHDYGPENISDAQVEEAVSILNADYRKLNPDLSQVVASFSAIAGDAEIEFRLAQLDPNGNCTNGINRIASLETYEGDDGSKINQWPRSSYLNIWVVKNISIGAAGYTYLPAATAFTPADDGIIILHDYIGQTIGTANGFGHHSLSHEVGHWLNLKHTWGSTNTPGISTNCNDDDDVADTPNTIGVANSSCNTAQNSCNSLDNIQNFMDYSSCDRMFTAGQVTRVRAALTSFISQRNNLWTSANLTLTGTNTNPTLCAADFEAEQTTVCAGQAVTFADQSFSGQNSWNWSFPGAIPSSSTDSTPTVTYYTVGKHDVSLSVGNGSSTVNTTKSTYIKVLSSPGDHPPYSEGFENSPVTNDSWTKFPADGSSYSWNETSNTAYGGFKSLKMNNFGNSAGSFDEVESSAIDLSTLSDATVTFQVAFAQKTSSSNDKLWFYISNNCGETWSPKFAKSGASLATAGVVPGSFIPSGSAQWREETISLSASNMTENFRFKFKFDSDGGNNLYIDDINISGNWNQVPNHISPSDGATNVGNIQTLDWKSVGNVDSYDYQLDITPAFSSGSIITGNKSYISTSPSNTDTEFETSTLTNGQQYYWRVRSITSGTPSAWSNYWTFTVSSSGIGIEEESSGISMSVIPNPASTISTLNINSKSNLPVSISLFDLVGKQTVIKESAELISGNNYFNIDANKLAAGIYFIKVFNDKEHVMLIRKFIVNK